MSDKTPRFFAALTPVPAPRAIDGQESFFYLPVIYGENYPAQVMADFTEEDIEGPAGAADLTSKQAGALIRALRHDLEAHHDLHLRINRVVRRATRNKNLQPLLRALEQFDAEMETASQDVIGSLTGGRYGNLTVEGRKNPDWLKMWMSDLQGVKRLANDIRSAINQPRKGRPSAVNMEPLLQKMAEVYEDVTGRQASRIIDPKSGTPIGPFHHVVKVLLAKAGSELTDHGVDRILKSFLADQKRRARKPTP